MVESNRLMIVDDDPSIGDLIGQVAEAMGFQTVFVAQSDQMLDSFRSFQPTLVTLDLMMPGVDGVQSLRTLASECCEADIILFSGADRRVLNTAARFGESHGLQVRELLRKPVEVDHLEAVLARFVQVPTEDLEEAFREAASKGDIAVHYQPKVDLSTASEWETRGIEALARWAHPTAGQISPEIFVPLAEKIGLIGRLTEIVVENAVHQSSTLRRSGYTLETAVNLSPLVLSNPAVPDRLARKLARSDISPGQIIVEVTESAAMAEGAIAIENLMRFRLKGLKLSLDDFGTRCSSLIQLYRMPCSELKIDRCFVKELDKSEEARVIVQSIVDLAHNLGLTVCAEGIETPETLKFLRSIGCDQGQGFLISPPLSEADLVSFLEIHKPSEAAQVTTVMCRR